MLKIYALVLILLLPSTQLAQLPQNPQSRPLVFAHVTVIDATGAPAKPDMTIVIEGSRIVALDNSRHVRIPKDAQVIDARGKFLIPGLWDMHVHTIDKSFLDLYIANGITGVRDMFGPIALIKQWRKQIEEGKLAGPRIVAAGPIVDGPKPIWPGSLAVSNEAEGRQAVTTVKKGGSDFVKLYSLLPRDAYFAIADEAKRQGIPFAGHVPLSVSASEASDAGQKSIEHLDGVLEACSTRESELRKEALEETIKNPSTFVRALDRAFAKALDTHSDKRAAALFARFVKNNTWQCPTLSVLQVSAFIDDGSFINDARLKYIPQFVRYWWHPKNNPYLRIYTAEDIASAKGSLPKYLEQVGAMHRAGVELLAGTDAGSMYCFPGFSLHSELALLVKAGLTRMEALQTATRNPAKFLSMLDSLGTVERGKIADLVLLDANPLVDISNTEKINAVVVNGRLFDRRALDGMLAQVEAAANKK